MRFLNNFDPAKVFLPLALLFGVAFALLVPPFQSPDEPNHFLRAYQVSEGIFFPEKQDHRLGATLPASLGQVRDSFSFLKMNYEARTDKSLIFRSLSLPLDVERRTFLDFPNTAIYAPTAYLPQATAIALLRPFGATPLQMLYAARLANLLVWALLVLAAIRLMPFLKRILVALALLPASLVVAASANADVITNGLCWWLAAAALSSFEGKNFFLKQALAVAVVCANKLIALPLALLNFGKKRFALLLVVGLAAAFAWGIFAQKNFIPYEAYNPLFRDAQTLNEGVDPARQQAFIIENSLFFIEIALKSIVKTLPSMAAHFAGKFGWEKNYLPPFWLALLWLMLAGVLVSEENSLSKKRRMLAAGVAALYVGMFAVTMYALWCPVGAGEVTNFQGRYFVPVAPAVALALAGGWLKKFENQIWLAALFILIMSNLAMIISIFERYYAT
jgi:uncharacterized membrane protein